MLSIKQKLGLILIGIIGLPFIAMGFVCGFIYFNILAGIEWAEDAVILIGSMAEQDKEAKKRDVQMERQGNVELASQTRKVKVKQFADLWYPEFHSDCPLKVRIACSSAIGRDEKRCKEYGGMGNIDGLPIVLCKVVTFTKETKLEQQDSQTFQEKA